MTNILIASDKFKGSLSAKDACAHLANGINFTGFETNITLQPMADGGEGSLSVLDVTQNIDLVHIETVDALFRPIRAIYGIMGNEAYIESSAACGLLLLNESDRNPCNTSTYGVGLMIKDAISKGCKVIHLFLGGSASNDGGMGMACALGYQMLDKNNKPLKPIGRNLLHINRISRIADVDQLSNIKFYCWSDVQSPMTGPNGASLMFARQKGASIHDIPQLEQGMQHLNQLFIQNFGTPDMNEIKGSGAAGGLAAGAVAILDAEIGLGVDFIMDKICLEEKIIHSDYVISGEGSIDNQSLEGKVIFGIASLCKKHHKKLIIVGGKVKLSKTEIEKLGYWKCYALVDKCLNTEESIKNSGKILEEIGTEIGIMISRKK